MPSYTLESNGKSFTVEAPDPQTAVAAFKKFTTSQPAEPSSAGVSNPMGDSAPIEGGAPAESMSYGDQMRKVGGALDSTARMIANGATFGLADKFAGGMNYLTGNAPSYTEGVKSEREKTQAIRDYAPKAAMLGEAIGGVGTGTGLMKSGLTLAGRVGPGLLPRVLGYGAEGAAYGAAQGAGNTFSENASDYLKNAGVGAATGAAIGGALPVAGSLAGTAYRAGAAFLGPRVEGVGRGASALLRGSAMADEQGLRNLGQLGPDAMLPDAGPSMLGLAQGAGTGTGPGRSELIGNLANRDRETAQRLAQSLDTNLGPAPIPSRVEANLNGSRALVGQAYEPVLANARPADMRPLARQLDAVAEVERGPAQRAARQVREMLGDGVHQTDPAALLNTRQAIDGMMATEVDPNTIRVLEQTRVAVDDALAQAVPGIKEVDAQVAELSRQSDALKRGSQILDTGKEAIRPVELADELVNGAQPQGLQVGPSAAPVRLRQGARAEIDRRVGTNINDLTQLEKTFATPQDWNYQKLGQVFGEGPRDKVAADIIANRTFRDTYQKVAQNSQSAQRLEAAKAMEGAAGGNVPTDITATSLGLKAVNAIAKILSGQSNATTRDEIGRVLASRGPDAQRIAQLLLNSAQATNANARSVSALLSSPEWIAAANAANQR